MRKLRSLLAVLIIFCSLSSCKKTISEKDVITIEEFKSAVPVTGSGTCFEITQQDWYNDTVNTPTLLGDRLLNNPYSYNVMRQASINLYGNANSIAINKKYVRFKPSSEAQLEELSNLDIEVFDYPL